MLLYYGKIRGHVVRLFVALQGQLRKNVRDLLCVESNEEQFLFKKFFSDMFLKQTRALSASFGKKVEDHVW